MRRALFSSLLLIFLFPFSLLAQDTVRDPSIPVPSMMDSSALETDTAYMADTTKAGTAVVPDEVDEESDRKGILLSDESLRKGFSFITLLRGFLGMLFIMLIAYVFSTNRRAIAWRVVLTGLSIQVLLAIGVLQVPFIQAFFEFFGKVFVKIVDFTLEGSKFLFKSMSTGEIESPQSAGNRGPNT